MRFLGPEIDMENPRFKVGKVFSSKGVLKEAIISHRVKQGKLVKFKRSEGKIIESRCRGKSFGLFIFASEMGSTTDWAIKTVEATHNCGRSFDPKILCLQYLAKR